MNKTGTVEINGIEIEIKDRAEELDILLLKVKKALIGLNMSLRDSDIPLKLVLQTYDHEHGFKHLTNQDSSRIKEAPKMIAKQDFTNFEIFAPKWTYNC